MEIKHYLCNGFQAAHQMKQYYTYDKGLELESGDRLSSLTIAYSTYGTLSPDRSNVVWVMHALTADSDVAEWWPHTVEKNKFLDPGHYFVVCANVLGSCYGTTGPTSTDPKTGQPYYDSFPDVTVGDMVECHRLLAAHLGIKHIDTIIGSSLGGFQAIEWLVRDPDIADKAILIATDYRCRPWLAAINKSMTMAVYADATMGEKSADAGHKGLAAARAIGLLAYRSCHAFDSTQDEPEGDGTVFDRKVHHYQEYQGKKLCDRFDAYSYVRMCRAADSHDVGRGRGSRSDALGRIKARCLVIAISSDILFPPSYHKEMAKMIPSAEYHEIESDFAHDGFLIEHEKLNRVILDFRQKADKINIQGSRPG